MTGESTGRDEPENTEDGQRDGEEPQGAPKSPRPVVPDSAPRPHTVDDGPTTSQARWATFRHEMLTGNWVITLLAIVAAMLISSVLIAVADSDVRSSAGYFFSRPSDMLAAVGDSVAGTYIALFRGSVLDYAVLRQGFSLAALGQAIAPLTKTMVEATPLIFAALGIGIGFRSGLFNIGAQGQVLMGAATASLVGFTFVPPGGTGFFPSLLHVVVAIGAAVLVAGLWAGIAGFLKARTGANEVIVTIMLNWIATYLVAYLLTTSVYRIQGNRPIAPHVLGTAELPSLLGGWSPLHWGFPLALLAAVGGWWLMERSTVGFQFRAVGANSHAARTAGITVNRVFVMVMVAAGMLAGAGGAMQILGVEGTFRGSSAGTIGFDAITVALLGRNRPGGIVASAMLFGALRAGAALMQTEADTPVDIILVIQAVIVLFIAAPPLVRSMFRLPGRTTRARTVTAKEATS
ncbi:ABC transporter permease [Ruania alba]|uniref:Nucleoside ABC transporter membrane protein n=1 Tax=Ruania alba TaxID=648782 RepID=A0A1H5CMN2_9MICO|nr:ABC transporter permease [Ruania alba]SED67871.1 nucleoside ABC transporter membrane protein [Ruania alba]